MQLSTATKLRFARALYRGIRLIRGLSGAQGDIVHVRRQGLHWRLDLSEGIDLALFLFGRFERSTSAAIRATVQPGMVVFDIGANIGAHALPMARMVGPHGKVYAFEPTEWAYDRLVENRDLNPDLRSTLSAVHAGLGRAGHHVPSHSYASWNVNSTDEFSHPVHQGSLRPTGAARSLTMDEAVDTFALDRLDFIKLDVDGYETDILSGGTATLERFRPQVLFELCPYALMEQGTTPQALLEALRSHGYRFYELNGSPFEARHEHDIKARAPKAGSVNLIARPRCAR